MSADAAELRILRAELLDAHRELVRLRTQTEQLVASNRDLSGLLSSSAERMGELLKVVVAFRRLLESPDAATAWRNVGDILVNVIGTEDFVIMLVGDQPVMEVIGGMGASCALAREEPPSLRAIQQLEDGRTVPLYIAERVVGAIRIGALLPQRDALGEPDAQVLTLISRFAASAVMMAEEQKGWARLTPPYPLL